MAYYRRRAAAWDLGEGSASSPALMNDQAWGGGRSRLIAEKRHLPAAVDGMGAWTLSHATEIAQQPTPYLFLSHNTIVARRACSSHLRHLVSLRAYSRAHSCTNKGSDQQYATFCSHFPLWVSSVLSTISRSRIASATSYPQQWAMHPGPMLRLIKHRKGM